MTFEDGNRRTFAELPAGERRIYLAIDDLVTSLGTTEHSASSSISARSAALRGLLPLAARFPIVKSAGPLYVQSARAQRRLRVEGVFPRAGCGADGPTLDLHGRHYRATHVDATSIEFEVPMEKSVRVPITISIPWSAGRWWQVGAYCRTATASFALQLVRLSDPPPP